MERNLLESSISTSSVVTILDSLKLIDLVSLKLYLYGISLDEYLNFTNQTLITLRNKDLRLLIETINKLAKDGHFITLNDLTSVPLEEESISKRA